jgi:hypothetical protein
LTKPGNSVRSFYTRRAADFGARAEALRARARITSNARLILFFIVMGVLVVLEGNTIAFVTAAILGTALFIGAVAFHRRVRARLRDAEDRKRLSELGIARIERNWNVLPVVLTHSSAENHPYAGDLDLFGGPAVSQLFGPVRTLHGARTLRHWLEHAASINVIEQRQAAVRELAGAVEFRETLAVTAGRIPRPSQRRVHAFLKWIDLRTHTVALPLVILARGLPLVTFTVFGLAAAGLITPVWAYAPVFAAILVSVFTLQRAYRAFDAAFTSEPAPLNYAATFAVAEAAPAHAPMLQDIQKKLHAGRTSAARSIRQLERIMHNSDARRSGIFAIILELLFLWSLNVLIALERWRRENAKVATTWFEGLGELEALSATATLAHDHPEWCFADIDAQADRITASGIGHPMLSENVRVSNDIEVGPKGTVLLITGSNMSGKSTMLRAVGVNTVLALAGAPVCSTAFRTPPVRLHTSINVHDSLAMGASLYMAQLARLKQIVEAARRAGADQPCCYLLDEILSGTNSADRTTAVRAIVHELLQLNAFGALTTHDLALAADPTIARHAVPIHFAETIDSAAATMTFDYRVRPGIVQSSNALALMKLMGFRLDEP